MLVECLKRSNVDKMQIIAYSIQNSCWCFISITKKEINGRANAVDIAAKPETFVIRKMITHTKLASPQRTNEVARRTPKVVATPLPPLNP